MFALRWLAFSLLGACFGAPAFAQINTVDDARNATVAPVIDLVAGDNRTCARLRDGSWKCWGEAAPGLGTSRCGALPCDPKPVAAFPGSVRYVVTGKSGCGLDQNGTLSCWGVWANGSGRPVETSAPRGARQVSQSRTRLCVSTSDNKTACRERSGGWKEIPYGDLFYLSNGDKRTALVRHGHLLTLWDGTRGVDIGVPTRHVAFGADATYLVSRDWQLYVLAGETATPATDAGSVVHAAADAVGHHACVSQRSGSVACVGANSAGELGNGDTEGQSSWSVVPGLSGSQRVAVGTFHSCALTTAGEVYCWGSNHAGQLGVDLAVVNTDTVRGKGGSKVVIVRDNGPGQADGSMCRLPREFSQQAVPCSLTPVRVPL